MTKKLTAYQRAFVREFLLCRSGSEALRRIGYKGKNADSGANQILQKPHVQAVIAAAEAKVAEKYAVTHEKLVQELAYIAFGSAGDVLDWTAGTVSFIPKAKLPEHSQKFIESISEGATENGRTLKMTTLASSKIKAIELLGKRIGTWRQETPSDKANGPMLKYNLDQPAKKKV